MRFPKKGKWNLGGAALAAAGILCFLLYFLRWVLPWLGLIFIIVGIVCLLR